MDIETITKDYILHNKTFQEIGDQFGISKQAVHAFYKRHKHKTIQLVKEFENISVADDFCNQMKFKRKTLNITQEQLADKIGTFKSNISVIESGKIKRSKYIGLICKELNINC
mgnify:FL=1|jgi:ribosome-binding protein aMBF1 (putative translation factor)|tara:strand:- start:88 stop:426 length:339 start_codon:yes stop_codon:yes gene_type:complete